MRKIFVLLVVVAMGWHPGMAQIGVRYDPTVQPTENIDYFKPRGNLFVGDCIPFYHNHTYYLYWLLDSAHHKALNGLGGHQWALSTSTDLRHWKHYPVVLGIDEAWEKSICTGSVEYHGGKFYAFYATRLIDSSGKVNEQLSYAVSDDGIHFVKQQPNPFYTSAPGYSKRHFRDPKVVIDGSGVFHLFVASALDSSQTADNGALVHLVSKDLKDWKVLPPLIYGQADVPECPDYFLWNGWYYLVYGRGGNTFYLKSRHPYGPWEYPRYQALNEDWVNVAKTAEFNGRRIVAGWVPSRSDGEDNGGEIFGGNIILRELRQEPDGTLDAFFPAEAGPATDGSGGVVIGGGAEMAVGGGKVSATGEGRVVNSPNGLDAFFLKDIPKDAAISFVVRADGPVEEFGCYLRSGEKGAGGYRLLFAPGDRSVGLADTRILGVEGLDKPVKVEIVMKGDIIDVCIGGKRCIVNRLYENKGSMLGFFAKHGTVHFASISVKPLQ